MEEVTRVLLDDPGASVNSISIVDKSCINVAAESTENLLTSGETCYIIDDTVASAGSSNSFEPNTPMNSSLSTPMYIQCSNSKNTGDTIFLANSNNEMLVVTSQLHEPITVTDSSVTVSEDCLAPKQNYNSWERACDECGRTFAYLDVHLSRNKSCRAAYDLKELRKKLTGSVNPIKSPKNISSASKTLTPQLGNEALEEKAHDEFSKNNKFMFHETPRIPDTKKRRSHDTTLIQLQEIQDKLQECNERLNACEQLSKSLNLISSKNCVTQSKISGGCKDDPSKNNSGISPLRIKTNTFRLKVPLDDQEDTSVISKCNDAGNKKRSKMSPKTKKTPSKSRKDSTVNVESGSEDDGLDYLGKNYLLSSQNKKLGRRPAPLPPAPRMTYIQKSSCLHCGARVKYILSHLSKSFQCQVKYDMTKLREESHKNKLIRQKYYIKHFKRNKVNQHYTKTPSSDSKQSKKNPQSYKSGRAALDRQRMKRQQMALKNHVNLSISDLDSTDQISSSLLADASLTEEDESSQLIEEEEDYDENILSSSCDETYDVCADVTDNSSPTTESTGDHSITNVKKCNKKVIKLTKAGVKKSDGIAVSVVGDELMLSDDNLDIGS